MLTSIAPAQLDPAMAKEPRSTQGNPRPGKIAPRKAVPSMIGLNIGVDGLDGLANGDRENLDPAESAFKQRLAGDRRSTMLDLTRFEMSD